MSGNLKEQVKRCQNVRIRGSHKRRAVTMAQGIIGTSAVMFCGVLVARWSKQGWQRSLIWLTLPPEAGPESKGRSFPREIQSSTAGGDLGTDSMGLSFVRIRGWAPGIFPRANPSHSMSKFILLVLSEAHEVGGLSKMSLNWMRNKGEFTEIILQKRPPAIWVMRAQTSLGVLNDNMVPLGKPAWGFALTP